MEQASRFEIGDTVRCGMYNRTFKTCGIVSSYSLLTSVVFIIFTPRPVKGQKMFFNYSFFQQIEKHRLEHGNMLLTEKIYKRENGVRI